MCIINLLIKNLIIQAKAEFNYNKNILFLILAYFIGVGLGYQTFSFRYLNNIKLKIRNRTGILTDRFNSSLTVLQL